MENSKWLATVACIWIQCSSGASYTFGIYSAVLKSSQGYDQSTLDTVSVFKDIGANIGVLSGLLYDGVTHNNRGSSPWFGSGLSLVYMVGAVQCFVGYFCMWLSITGVIDRPHVLLVCLFMFLAAHAQTFFNTANVVVAVRNFPGYGGTSVGIIKGFLGLSDAILIQIYHTLFDGKPTTFVLMLAIFPTVVSLALMSLVHANPSNTTNDKPHLNNFSLIALAIAAYLMIIIIFENIFTFPSWAHILTTTILMLMVLSPLQVALKAHRSDTPPPVSPVTTPLITDPEAKDNQLVEIEINLMQAMCTVNFWLLFLAMVCALGSGLATINNITQLGESLDYSTVEIHAMISLWSIWNFLGRFGGGFLSDLYLNKYGWGRPLFISFTQLIMIIGYLIIGLSGNLYVGSVIVGVCYGSQWSLMPTITSEIFGVKHMGTIFNTIATANPIGSYILSVQVIGNIYDKQAGSRGGSCHEMSLRSLMAMDDLDDEDLEYSHLPMSEGDKPFVDQVSKSFSQLRPLPTPGAEGASGSGTPATGGDAEVAVGETKKSAGVVSGEKPADVVVVVPESDGEGSELEVGGGGADLVQKKRRKRSASGDKLPRAKKPKKSGSHSVTFSEASVGQSLHASETFSVDQQIVHNDFVEVRPSEDAIVTSPQSQLGPMLTSSPLPFGTKYGAGGSSRGTSPCLFRSSSFAFMGPEDLASPPLPHWFETESLNMFHLSDFFAEAPEVDPSTADDKFVPEWDLKNKDRIIDALSSKMLLMNLQTPAERVYQRGLGEVELADSLMQSLARVNMASMEMYRRWVEAEAEKIRMGNQMVGQDVLEKTRQEVVNLKQLLEQEKGKGRASEAAVASALEQRDQAVHRAEELRTALNAAKSQLSEAYAEKKKSLGELEVIVEGMKKTCDEMTAERDTLRLEEERSRIKLQELEAKFDTEIQALRTEKQELTEQSGDLFECKQFLLTEGTQAVVSYVHRGPEILRCCLFFLQEKICSLRTTSADICRRRGGPNVCSLHEEDCLFF